MRLEKLKGTRTESCTRENVFSGREEDLTFEEVYVIDLDFVLWYYIL